VLDNKLLRMIFRSKLDKVTGSGEKYIMRSLKIRTLHQILFGISNRGDGRDKYWVENRCRQGVVGKLQRKCLLGRRRHRGEDNIKLVIQDVG